VVWVISILLIVPLVLGACAPATPAPEAEEPAAEEPAAEEEETKTIGVTLFTRAHQFYQDMEATWEEYADDHGFEMLIQNAEVDVAAQTSQIEDFIQQEVDAMIVCAVDPQGIVPAIEEANNAGIPVLTVDGPAAGGDIVTFIGTDNFEGGRVAGEFAREYIEENLGGEANVAILDFPQSAVVCVNRVNGFKSELEDMPGVEIVAQQDGGAMRDKSMAVFENVLSANPDIDVVFGINDDTILGAMAAAEGAGRLDEMIFIGYDGTPEAVEMIASGDSQLVADVAQQPVEIAKTALDVLDGVFEGETYDDETPVAPILITEENADEFLSAEAQAAMAEEEAEEEEGPKRIGVTLFTRAHQFYQDMEATWEANAADHGYEMLIQNAEVDVAAQTSQIEDFIQQEVDAMIVCAVDPQGIVPAIEEANNAGIPVITVDGPASGGDIVTFIGTDNFEGGRVAGEFARKYIEENLGGEANVAILDFPQSAVVCVNRVNGFKSELEDMPGVEIVAQQDGGAMRDKSMAVFENVLSANPEIDVVFGINDDTILGAMAAAEGAGRLDDMIFIGYDGTPEAVEMIASGESQLKADVAQQPVEIALTALDVLDGVFAGQTYDAETPVAPILITEENAADFME
jgi:ribose transport system substrate-binding protein